MNKIILLLLFVTIYYENELSNGKAMGMLQQEMENHPFHLNNALESINVFLGNVQRRIQILNEEEVITKY